MFSWSLLLKSVQSSSTALLFLKEILPSCFLNHYFLFVYGIYTLLGDSISMSAICLAEVCLTKFVIKVEELYGLSSCKFNVHFLTHLAHCVKDCGPLWATSTFTFESHNHVLINMFHGTQCVPKQITDTFLLRNKISSLTRTHVDDNSSACLKEAVGKLTENARFTHNSASGGLLSLGSAKLVTLNASMLIALEHLLNLTVDNHCGKMYNRFLFNHKLYSSVNYTRSKRHTNHNVSVQHPAANYGMMVLGF